MKQTQNTMNTKKITEMSHEEIMALSHQDLMALSKEEKQAYSDAVNLDFHNKVKIAIDNGFTHIQIGYAGCIKVRKNKNGIFYSIRNGKGTGQDCAQFTDLRDCTKHLMHNGWGNNITYR
jgi:hypothetical protein